MPSRSHRLPPVAAESIEPLIQFVRGQKIILDSDLARIYGVPVKRLNEQVKRNIDRFPADFMFQRTGEEVEALKRLRSQIATLKTGQHRKYLPYAFTEHGAIMAANVLRSRRAVAMSVFDVRAFVRMREMLTTNKVLSEKLMALERKLTARLDLHEDAILKLLEEIRSLTNSDPPLAPSQPRREIGFHVKEMKR
jgi:hypothetical protein